MNLLRDTVKAGAYVLYEGQFIFMFGYNDRRDMLGVVRLGGHRESDETPVQCAIREVREECMLEALPFDAPETFFEAENRRTILVQHLDSPRPVWVKQQDGAGTEQWTVMYLARANGMLKPNMETQGLICVNQDTLRVLCTKHASLRKMRENGASVHLSVPLPEDIALTPTSQVYFLNWLLDNRPEWFSAYLH